MKIVKLAFWVSLLAAIPIQFPAGAGAQEISTYMVITATDLWKMQDSGKEILIIDTLGESAFRKEHIPGAKNFEFPNGTMDRWNPSKTAERSQDDFVALLGPDKEKPLIFYCFDEK